MQISSLKFLNLCIMNVESGSLTFQEFIRYLPISLDYSVVIDACVKLEANKVLYMVLTHLNVPMNNMTVKERLCYYYLLKDNLV